MTIPTTKANDKDNICCPDLEKATCAESNEHCHLVCGFSDTPISNDTARDLCIGQGFNECVNRRLEAS
jgi:hypothetical protein